MNQHPAAHTLMPLVIDPARLRRAARQCMRRASAPGADGITWKTYRADLDDRLRVLGDRLRQGTWQPSPLRQLAWPDWDKRLPVTIPTVEDRIVHRALRNAAEPILEHAAYQPWSYGWRRRAGHVEAVAAAARHIQAGRRWVADLDVAAASAGAHPDEPVDWLARWIHDGSFLELIRRILRGLPAPLVPGSGLSPMLTNLRLVQVDEQLAALTLIRLTDNYTAFCFTRAEARQAAERISTALSRRGLAPNLRKSKIWCPNPEDLYLAG
ncbi:reverse transcriptase domain-containing protein [Actinomadura sp. SCN-SB]|uniref:reverse transcriptase domain-containing protein n=1 Tax=Actinomadura sp. SCN-SB TaxID=3373092 RepID=UPI003751C2D7